MEKIAAVLEKIGLPFAYDHFAEGESPNPPFICYLIPNSDNFSATAGSITKSMKSISNCIPTARTCRQNRKLKLCLMSMAFFMKKPRYGSSRRAFTKSCTHLKWR